MFDLFTRDAKGFHSSLRLFYAYDFATHDLKINKKESDSLDIDFQVKGYSKVVGFVTYSEYGKMINAYILKVSNGFDMVFADGPLKGSYAGKWINSYLENSVQDLNTNDPIPWGPSK